MSLTTGTAVQAPSYSTSSTETPTWMQDAIYNQIQQATNVAQTPYQAYNNPLVASLDPLQQQAYGQVQANQGLWAPSLQAAQEGTLGIASGPGGYSAAQPYAQAASQMSGLQTAQPYLNAAGQSSVSNIQDYMNPYTRNVTDEIARLGARNLSENLLPGVSDSFVKAGQFGSNRMGEFGSRAVRDTQDSILNQQAQALQSGYGQALGASQTDLSRQASLGSTAGQLASTQQNALMTLGQQAGTLSQADIARQQSALGQLANMAQQGQAMGAADVASLEAAGLANQNYQQNLLNSAKSQWDAEQAYPRQQLDWLSTQVRGMAPITPQTTTQSGYTTQVGASPLSQLASGLAASAGLYQTLK